MDDGELDFSNQEMFDCSSIGELCSMDGLLDELLCNDTLACSHTHFCNPPGPDSSHTHTCFHVHTKIVAPPNEDKVSTGDTVESTENKSNKRPCVNREAVRKYREKKKAQTASVEEEVVRLRAMNQQLMKRLQSLGALEAEIARLKSLLVYIRGTIEGGIGSFPYQKSMNDTSLSNPNMARASVRNSCKMQCDDQVYCLHPGEDMALNGQCFGGCEFEHLQCIANQNAGMKEIHGCGLGNGASC